jgi:hypothetical protein
MARNGSDQPREKSSFGGSCPVACFAPAESAIACKDVIWRVLMAVRAMCFCALSSAISQPSKRKPRLINPAGFVKKLFKSLAFFGARNNRVRFQSGFFCQLYCKVCLAFNRNFFGDFSIALLLLLRCPSAIFWRVWAVIINALNGSSGRARPHVLQEIFKPAKFRHPSFANVDSPPSVVWISPAVGISASLLHGLKTNVFRNLCAYHTAHFSAK